MFSNQLGILLLLILQFGYYCYSQSGQEKESQTFLENLSKSLGRVTQSTTCGIRNIDPEDPRTEAPWNAVIFTKYQAKNGTISYGFFGSGVVIGANMILVISNGAYGAGTKESNYSFYSIPPVERFIAVVGLKSIRFDDSDQHTQISEINYIVPYIGKGEVSDEFHFVIYHLKTVLKPTNYVREICFLKLQHLNSRDYLQKFRDSFNFQITGFALSANFNTSYSPLTRDITLESQSLCDSAYPFYHGGNFADNILCARPIISEYVAFCHFYGSALTFTDKARTSRTFLGAVLTSSSKYGFQKGGPCSGKRVNFFTPVAGHAVWIANNYKCSPTRFSCGNSACLHLSKVCNGLKDCPDGEDEDRHFCAAVNICPGKLDLSLRDVYYQRHTSVCGYRGKCLQKNSICDGIDDCLDGSDESPEICVGNRQLIPSSVSECDPPILTSGVEITSCRNVDSSSCGLKDDQRLGTFLNITCSKYHISKYSYNSVRIQCTQGGHWEFEKPFSCSRDCGLLDESKSQSKMPWNVNIFAGSYAPVFICSGTLIEEIFAVTGEDCLNKINTVNKNVILQIGSASTEYDPDRSDTVSITRTDKMEILTISAAILTLTKSKESDNLGNLPACYDKVYSVIKPTIGSMGMIPVIIPNKGIGQISLKKYKVVACPETPTPYFCVEGPANSNFGQGFFVTNDQRYSLVGIVTSKKSQVQSGGHGGTEILYVLTLNSLNPRMLPILEREYS